MRDAVESAALVDVRSMFARASHSHSSARARAEMMRMIADESWPTRLVRGIRARVGELDPEARRADEDADPKRPGGVFDACARGDAALARDVLRDGNACVRWLLFGEASERTGNTAVHGA